MFYSVRSMLAALVVAGFASLVTVSADARTTPSPNRSVDALVLRSEQANQALMRGDIATYRSMISLTDDFVLMSPFGGPPSRPSSLDPAQWETIGRFFRDGTLEQDLVQAYASPDMIVLALIERAHVAVGGLPAQPWALRVTLVYRREGSDWRLAHRHADPLVGGITLAQSAALAGSGSTSNGVGE